MNIHTQSRQIVVETKRRRSLSPKDEAEKLFSGAYAKPIDHAVMAYVGVGNLVGVAGCNEAKRPATKVASNDSAVSMLAGVYSQVVILTPEEARFMRDNYHFERQRSISVANVDRLVHEMHAGRLIPGMQIYLCEMPDGSRVIVNGNHTCEAIHKSGVAQVITITKKAVSDIEEAGRIYAVFDTQKARSWIDSLKATGVADDMLNATVASKVLAAIGSIENKFEQSGRARVAPSRIDRIEKMAEFQETADLLFKTIAGCQNDTKRFIHRAAILSVALVTFRYQPSAAAEFWRSFAMDDGLAAGMPSRALLAYLRNNRLDGSDGRKLQARAAALTWNAHFEGRSQHHVKPAAFVTFAIKGTPYQKGLGLAEE